jgi:AsmA protein
VALSAQAASASLSARGTVPSSFAGGGFDLTVDLRAPNLAELAPLAAHPLPDIRNIVLDAHLGDAGFKLRGLHLADLSFASSLGDLAGNVTLAWLPVPTLTGTLTSHRFDIDAARAAVALLMAPPPDAVTPPPAPQLPPPPAVGVAPPPAPAATEPPPPERLIPDDKLPMGAFRGADGNLTVSADRITAGGENFSDLQAHVLANDGKLIINPLRVTSVQGAIIGAFSLDAGIDPPAVSVSLRSPSLSAARLASLAGYPGGATGTVQVDARFSGTGDTPRALAATLTGHLGLTMVDGSITETLLNAMFANALGTAGVPQGEGSSDVRCFAGRAEIIGGKARIDALSLDTSRLSVDGDGTIDFNDEMVALHLRPILRVGGTAVAAPVTVSGPLSALKPALDPVLGGGRVGFTIGGAPPSDDSCIAQLSLARGGLAGPMPSVQAPVPGKKKKKPIDLLQGLFH